MILLGGFGIVVPDGLFRLELTHSLLTEGSFITSHGPINYAPLQSILMIPAFAIGYYYGMWSGFPPDKMLLPGSVACFFLYLPVIVSVLLVLFFKILEEMGVDGDTNIVSTFTLLCSTFLLPYSKGMFSESLSALLILASFYYFLKAQSGRYGHYQRKNFICLSLLILNNFVFVLYSGLMLAYVYWGSRVRRKNSQEAWRATLEGLLILSVGVGLFLGYNYLRFGQWFNFGYPGEGFTNNMMVGLYGLFFSFGHGLIIFAPVTILCIVFYVFKNHEMEPLHRHLFTTSLISFVCYLIVYAKWGAWHGGWCWGPRFLLPFVPLIHVMFPLLWKSVSPDNRVLRAGILLALAWGIGVNLIHIAIPSIPINDLPSANRIFIPENSNIFIMAGSGLDGLLILKGLGILGACACLLWIWKKRFIELPAPSPSAG